MRLGLELGLGLGLGLGLVLGLGLGSGLGSGLGLGLSEGLHLVAEARIDQRQQRQRLGQYNSASSMASVAQLRPYVSVVGMAVP